VSAALTRERLSNTVDTTGTTVGKRYARTDEIGVPFAITIDYQTLEDGTATLRERDSTAQVRPPLVCPLVRSCQRRCWSLPTMQVRVPVAELPGLVRRLTDMEVTWTDVTAQYPAQAASSVE
jgi:glycyl-tRNA synthetase